MKVVYSSVNLVSFRQLKYLLLLPFLVASAFGSDEFGHSSGKQERNTRDTDFLRLKREVIDELKTNAQNIRDADFLRLKREIIDDLKTNAQNIRDADFIRLKKEVVDALKTKKDLEESYGGAVYIRWGRNVCGPGSDALYRGVAGGSWWDTYGGGSNYLCLPLQPIWGAYNEGAVKYSQLYGAEYELPSAFGLNNNHNLPLHNNNVPCVVCRSQTKTSVVMIPARNQCYSGMHTEYTGYLMSGAAVHKGRTEFICMDREPESDPSGYRDENGALFHNVEAACGSLPCPPYTPRREVTCAVCTK